MQFRCHYGIMGTQQEQEQEQCSVTLYCAGSKVWWRDQQKLILIGGIALAVLLLTIILCIIIICICRRMRAKSKCEYSPLFDSIISYNVCRITHRVALCTCTVLCFVVLCLLKISVQHSFILRYSNLF